MYLRHTRYVPLALALCARSAMCIRCRARFGCTIYFVSPFRLQVQWQATQRFSNITSVAYV